MSIHDSLQQIQSKLKAPKGQFNSFGKYNYRSCEDILEGVKPHLAETRTTLTISDNIEYVGERYYIKATATLTDVSTGESVSVSALAREEENKKGMDASQLSGATSSYARKYALNGLFCIDDTKDSDATNQHGKGDQSSKPVDDIPEVKKGKLMQQIFDKAKAKRLTKEDTSKILAQFNVTKLDELGVVELETVYNIIGALKKEVAQ